MTCATEMNAWEEEMQDSQGIAEGQWGTLPDDVMELIFFKLPEVCAVRAMSVSKRWWAVMKSSQFSERYAIHRSRDPAPAFELKGLRYIPSGEAGNLVFTPIVEKSRSLLMEQCFKRADVETHLVDGVGGLIYSLNGSRVHYKLTLLDLEWRVTPPMRHTRCDPIVRAVIDSATGTHKIIFAGGVCGQSSLDDDLAMEIYNSATDSWETCDEMPNEFRGCSSSLFMSSFVHGDKFYVYETSAGFVASFDLKILQWGHVKSVRPISETALSFIMSRSNELYWVSVDDESEPDVCIEVRKMDEGSSKIGELVQRTIMLSSRPPPPNNIFRLAAYVEQTVSHILGVVLIAFVHLLLVLFRGTRRRYEMLKRQVNPWLYSRLPCSRSNYRALITAKVSEN